MADNVLEEVFVDLLARDDDLRRGLDAAVTRSRVAAERIEQNIGNASRGFDRVARGTRPANQAFEELGRESQETAREVNASTDRMTRGVQEFGRQAQANMGAASAEMNKARGSTFNLGAAISRLAIPVAAATGGLLAARGLVRGVTALAQAAERATIAEQVFERQLARSNVQVAQGRDLVEQLSNRFGVLPQTVREATTILLRAGGDMEDVERALTAAGASAAAAGVDITRAFDNVSVALATGRSELLETSGIITNLGPAEQAYAESVGKTVEELTQQERVQARVNAVFRETRPEIEDLDTLLSGLVVNQAEMNREWEEFRQAIGRFILPLVIEAVEEFTEFLSVLNDIADVLEGGFHFEVDWDTGNISVIENEVDGLIRKFAEAETAADFREVIKDNADAIGGNGENTMLAALDSFIERTGDAQQAMRELAQLIIEQPFRQDLAASRQQLAVAVRGVSEQPGAAQAEAFEDDLLDAIGLGSDVVRRTLENTVAGLQNSLGQFPIGSREREELVATIRAFGTIIDEINALEQAEQRLADVRQDVATSTERATRANTPRGDGGGGGGDTPDPVAIPVPKVEAIVAPASFRSPFGELPQPVTPEARLNLDRLNTLRTLRQFEGLGPRGSFGNLQSPTREFNREALTFVNQLSLLNQLFEAQIPTAGERDFVARLGDDATRRRILGPTGMGVSRGFATQPVVLPDGTIASREPQHGGFFDRPPIPVPQVTPVVPPGIPFSATPNLPSGLDIRSGRDFIATDARAQVPGFAIPTPAVEANVLEIPRFPDETVQAAQEAMEQLEERIDSLSGKAPTQFDEMRARIAEFAVEAGKTPEEIADLNAQVDKLEDQDKLLGVLGDVSGVLSEIGAAAAGTPLGELADGLNDIVGIGMKFASGDILGGVTSIFAKIIEGFTAASRAARQLEEDLDSAADSFALLSREAVEALGVFEEETKFRLFTSGTITTLNAEASQVGWNIANSLATGIRDGLMSGDLDIGALIDNLILEKIIESLILDEDMQTAIVEFVEALLAAIDPEGAGGARITDEERATLDARERALEGEIEIAQGAAEEAKERFGRGLAPDEPGGGVFGVADPNQLGTTAPQIALNMPSAAMAVTAAQPFVQAGNIMGQAADRLFEAATLIRDIFQSMAANSGGGMRQFYEDLNRAVAK